MSSAKQFKDRNGTLAGNILKRFNMIVDYQKATISLKKNSYFKEKFSYNKSGIELAHDGVRLVKEKDNKILNEKSGLTQNDETLNSNRIVIDTHYKLSLKPAYSIVELRKDSPAFNAGLMINDVVLSINGKPAHEFSLQQIIHMFYGDDGNRIKLKVDRNGKDLTFNFILKSPLK
jgi:C-terminal processing protease CtpA/Prc